MSLVHAQTTTISIQALHSASADDLAVMLQAIEETTPLPADSVTPWGTFWSVQHLNWPPLPGNINNVPAWDLGGDVYLLDDLGVDYVELQRESAAMGPPMPGGGGGDTNSYAGYGSGFQAQVFTTNDLWLQINGLTNDETGWTVNLTIHTPWNDTNLTHDLLYTVSLDPPIKWRFLMRCVSTNVIVSGLCEAEGFFALTQTNGNLTVSTNSTAQQLAQLLVPPWVIVTNASYTGAIVARGTFAGGNGCGLPIDNGVILSTGWITNAIGPNDDDGGNNYDGNYGPSNLGQPGDADLSNLVGNGQTYDAAVLEFDIISTNFFTLQFLYVFASEEYPEWIGPFNDPMAIFVSTNYDGTNWINSITNDIALVPGTTNMPVSVNTINGGCVSGAQNNNGGAYIPPTNPQYYVDNYGLDYSAATNAAPAPEFNIQYDGMTILLTAQAPITAGVTNHVKIAIADYGDSSYDSAIFVKPWSPSPCH
ncbi:MAG: choice-of-anchor L domain-containing protein [Limisphaerales bacterium]